MTMMRIPVAKAKRKTPKDYVDRSQSGRFEAPDRTRQSERKSPVDDNVFGDGSQPGAPRKRKASAGQKTPVLKRKSQLLSDSSDHNQHFISELTLFSLNRQLGVGLWTSDRIRRWSVKFCPNEEKTWPKRGDPFFFFLLSYSSRKS